MDQLHVCVFCRNTGKHGAQWILYIGTEPHPVHRPCGEELKKSAPEGAQVRLMPCKELAQRQRAQSFWSKNFNGKAPAREESAKETPAEARPSA